MTRTLGWVWLLVFGLLLFFLFSSLGSLPEHLAVHFDAAGKPNGFQDKGAFLVSFLTMISVMNGIFVLLFLMMGRIPLELIHVPSKAQWTSTPNSRTILKVRLKAIPVLLGLFLNFVFLLTLQIIYQENAPGAFFRIPMAGGLVLIFVCVVFLVLFIVILLIPPRGEG